MSFSPYSGDLLQHLASFVLLAHRVENEPRGAYEAAARELGIDVSVLRRRMQTLASWFGASLMEGRGSSLRLSGSGDAVVDGASVLLLDLERLRERLVGVPERLSVGYDGALGAGALPAGLKAARRAAPDLRLHVSTDSSDALVDAIRRGRLDLALVRAPEAPTGLQAHLLGEERVLLVVPGDHALAERSRVGLRDIAPLNIAMERSDAYTRARVLERLGDAERTILATESRAALYDLVDLGLVAGFIAALPRDTPRARGLVTHDVTRLFAPCSYFAVHASDREPAALPALLEALARQF